MIFQRSGLLMFSSIMDGAGLVLLTYKKKENDFEFKIISSFRDFESFSFAEVLDFGFCLV